jgi:ATP citrate (pro-S)-lyase
MSARPVREFDGKDLLTRFFKELDVTEQGDEKFEANLIYNALLVAPEDDLDEMISPFPDGMKLVVKPDQLIKRRGKLGLVGVNLTFNECLAWIRERKNKSIKIGRAEGLLNYFIIEPFVPHKDEEELYVAIFSARDGDTMMFYHQGGVDVGDVDAKAARMFIPTGDMPDRKEISAELLTKLKSNKTRDIVSGFLLHLYKAYTSLHFTYLEINPLVVLEGNTKVTARIGHLHILDLAAKLDETASFQCHNYWGDIKFPPQFGHHDCPEEAYIKGLDERTGASLKLTVLNTKGRIWTLVAGGGASVIYADTVSDLGGASELGNYGEYSGAPTESMTYHYAHTVIKLMLKHPHADGKVLLIGGGIANFTDVAATFKGICRAIRDNQEEMRENNTSVYVRRGGPNFEKGLQFMRECLSECGLTGSVHGPEDHITNIVARGLGKPTVEEMRPSKVDIGDRFDHVALDDKETEEYFGADTFCLVYGMQTRAVQGMLDFDYVSRRDSPSVVGIVYTFASGQYYRQFWFGGTEVLIPVYPDLETAIQKHRQVNTIVNFASSRSVFGSMTEIFKFSDRVKNVAIIAEGVPERETRILLKQSKTQNVNIIGPATVGGIFPGRFKIGNTGGMLSNQLASKLYRHGSVAYVSRSGGLSNELNNIISSCTDGVRAGVAIGGDRYPITTYMDHLIKFQMDPHVKILVLLGEVGGTLEYDVCTAIESGIITKPVIAWCTGTVASNFTYDVQFGHAGALANSDVETAAAKNEALRKCGCFVPESFQDFGHLLKGVYDQMVEKGLITPCKDVEPPKVPVDYQWAKKIGMVRKSKTFLSSIADERGEELVYGGVPISEVLSSDMGIGGTIGLLWFRRKLPDYFSKFIETVLVVTADHGPAVSGAHNCIVTARAGKDLVSALTSGLLTIGPRFGGALDDAARGFYTAFKDGMSAVEFVKTKRKNKELIMGIGHKIKSLENPDKRVEIVIDFARKHFKATKILDFGLQVQAVTTRKKSNLILNVDGAIACCFIDLMLSCGCFSEQEAEQYIEMGTLNALFVLGRSIGFIGHFLDQKRLNQGLYRHPTDDIAYMLNL